MSEKQKCSMEGCKSKTFLKGKCKKHLAEELGHPYKPEKKIAKHGKGEKNPAKTKKKKKGDKAMTKYPRQEQPPVVPPQSPVEQAKIKEKIAQTRLIESKIEQIQAGIVNKDLKSIIQINFSHKITLGEKAKSIDIIIRANVIDQDKLCSEVIPSIAKSINDMMVR